MSKEERNNDIYWIEMMIFFANRALGYYEEIRNSNYSQIVMEGLDDALASQIAHIGEQLGSNKLSEETKSKYPHILWKQIKDYRNNIIIGIKTFVCHKFTRSLKTS